MRRVRGAGVSRCPEQRLSTRARGAVGRLSRLQVLISCPEAGRKLDQRAFVLTVCRRVTPPAPQDLVRHVCTTTGLAPGTAERVIADVIAYFGETAAEFVRRRHDELHHRQYKNPQIWPL